MNIRNKYCRLSELTQFQIDKLRSLMTDTEYFDFGEEESLIGFSPRGNAGTWLMNVNYKTITYKEMLSLLGAKEEEKLVPHVHQKEIIAWANGEEIQTPDPRRPVWHKCSSPPWNPDVKYRVKPKLTPTQLRIQEVVAELQKLHEQDAVERGINRVMEDLDAT
jgi:hypothetical protein